MAWLDTAWKYRTPITFANNGGAGEIDGSFTIPKAMGKFWDNVQADVDDVRITAADGQTLLSYGFNTDTGPTSVADRRCTIEIEGYDVSAHITNSAASASVGGFMYWGNAAASAGATSVSISSAKTVLLELTSPGSATEPVLLCGGVNADQTYPSHRIGKQTTETTNIWWNLRRCIQFLRRPNQRSRRNEEIAYVNFTIIDEDGVGRTGAMTVVNSITISDNYMVRTPILAGVTGTRYLLTLTVGLIDQARNVRVIDQRATLIVKDLVVHTA